MYTIYNFIINRHTYVGLGCDNWSSMCVNLSLKTGDKTGVLHKKTLRYNGNLLYKQMQTNPRMEDPTRLLPCTGDNNY